MILTLYYHQKNEKVSIFLIFSFFMLEYIYI